MANKTQFSIQCPACRSNNVQSIEIAYEQSVRTGSSGFTSISELGAQLGPPEGKDDRFLPQVIVCIVGFLALVFLPSILDQTELEYLHGLSWTSWPVIALAFVLAWTAGLAVAIPAIRYNAFVLPKLLAEWRMQVFCRRCGKLFRPANDPKEFQQGGHHVD